MIQGSWTVISGIYTNLLNSYLDTGTFPDRWKHGRIHAVLKNQDRDDTEPRSYRPICLLSVLGKLMEKAILSRLLPHTDGMFLHQYGFLKGKPTVDAIEHLKNIATNTRHKYSIGIFANIQGAFDTIWWPEIINKLRDILCPTNLHNLI